MQISRNLIRAAKRCNVALRGITGERVLFASFPKAGRTWLRLLLGEYLARTGRLDRQVILANDVEFRGRHRVRLSYSHMVDLTEVGLKEISLAHLQRAHAMICLYRDPRDVAVSFYFQLTRRDKLMAAEDVGIGAFLLDPKLGLARVKEHYDRLEGYERYFPRVLRLVYEDVQADTTRELDRLLAFLGLDPVDEGHRDGAIRACAFEALKESERADAYGSFRLRPADAGDPDSFKVRRGKVGGYVDYLTGDERQRVDDMARSLFPNSILRADTAIG